MSALVWGELLLAGLFYFLATGGESKRYIEKVEPARRQGVVAEEQTFI